MGLMEVSDLLKWIITNNITVQDKEGRVVLAKDLSGQSQRTGSAKRLGLDREGDVDAIFLFVLFQSSNHDFRSVVYSQDNVGDTSLKLMLLFRDRVATFGCLTYLCKTFDLMKNHGSVGKLDEGFRESEGKRSETSTKACKHS